MIFNILKLALALTFRKEPEARIVCLMRNYAERYVWLIQVFSFMLVDEMAALKLCPNCYKAFFTENSDNCCTDCKSELEN